MEEAQILQITVLKGPQRGKVVAREPEFKINVGRVVRGNDLALRDPAISQKHLCFEFIQEDSRWFVSDLGTSNGTVLNGCQIEPSVDVPVSDGDVISIGEKTELSVKILTRGVSEEKEEGDDVKRRGVTRRGRTFKGTTSSGVSEEKSEVKEARSRVRALSARDLDQEERKEESFDPDLVLDSGVEVGRRGRGRGKEKIAMARVLEEKEKSKDVACSENEEPDLNREIRVRRNPRRGTSSRVLKDSDSNSALVESKGVSVKRKGRGKCKASTVSEEESEKEKSESDFIGTLEEKAEVNGIGEKERGETNSEKAGVDFEKMTLGEWFDSMEVFLPMAIRDEAEKIIRILKERAAKFDEFAQTGSQVEGV